MYKLVLELAWLSLWESDVNTSDRIIEDARERVSILRWVLGMDETDYYEGIDQNLIIAILRDLQ